MMRIITHLLLMSIGILKNSTLGQKKTTNRVEEANKILIEVDSLFNVRDYQLIKQKLSALKDYFKDRGMWENHFKTNLNLILANVNLYTKDNHFEQLDLIYPI